MTTHVTVEALSSRAFSLALADLDHETRAIVTATEHGSPWASVEVSPMTDTRRAVFPVDRSGVRGDTRKRGQSGVIVSAVDQSPLSVVIERARRMHRA